MYVELVTVAVRAVRKFQRGVWLFFLLWQSMQILLGNTNDE
ncbi:MAG TPA: hypothetical protein PLL06_11275 [Acidobacteriota bacterium]|nr:hypothetical protein [Acidobacteriota bacterium]HNC42653.1 hypothetical protein [Acidobacteriota bacterium]HNH83986.1 hypothetical protein [Acidobacteriota bacterium]